MGLTAPRSREHDDRPAPFATPALDSVRLTGSGATFAFPIYSIWFKSFSGRARA